MSSQHLKDPYFYASILCNQEFYISIEENQSSANPIPAQEIQREKPASGRMLVSSPWPEEPTLNQVW